MLQLFCVLIEQLGSATLLLVFSGKKTILFAEMAKAKASNMFILPGLRALLKLNARSGGTAYTRKIAYTAYAALA